MFCDKDAGGYNSLLEAHPLDPTSGFNREDGRSIIDEVALMFIQSVSEEGEVEHEKMIKETGATFMNMEVDLSWVDDFEAHLKRIRTEVVGFPVCFTGAVCDQWVDHMLYITTTLPS
jgi:hypothetical protein